MTVFNLALTAASMGLGIISSRNQSRSRAEQLNAQGDDLLDRSTQERMNASESFSQAAATRSEASSLRADANTLRATAENTRREADMQDISTQLYGFNVDQARSNARLLHMQADIEASGVELIGARQRLEESNILEAGRRTLASNRVYFAGNNLDTSTGSPMLAMARDAGKVAMDVELSRATGRLQALDVLKRAQNIEAAAVQEEGKGLSATLQQLGSSMKAQSLRLLGVSQVERAGSIDQRANSVDDRAASIDQRGFDFLTRSNTTITRAENTFARAHDEDAAGWIGAASAFLRGGSQLYNQRSDFGGSSSSYSGTGDPTRIGSFY